LLLKHLLNSCLFTLKRLEKELLHKHALEFFSSLLDAELHFVGINVVTVENESLHTSSDEVVLAQLHSEEVDW